MESTTQATTINMPVLQKGTSGEAVRFLQQVLIAIKYQKDHFDAQFNAETESAVKNFQKAHGLKVDGIVGPKTWRALGDAILKLAY
ncbi:peptidoglycan-binding protein [Phormidium sp. LEGE 05292]|uniref:peptidoglycan-binding domain-containing protein n=1 Tax=[Phormidium] sp. LEGE 05292 TaxID=767427 RepID=UPI0018826C32|nr:peptidoglycan-binding domain-containing protein [Phormidium sp. LEGE 05292]MBE9223885.1 peptidoglycan-binding protein [Phormidium sp. LEGE 05292]